MKHHIVGSPKGSPVGPPGVVLVLTILLVALFLAMGTTLLSLSSSDYQIATNGSRSIQALFNADAGLQEAKMRLTPTAPASLKIPVGGAATWRAYIATDPDAATASQSVLKARIQPLDSTYNSADAANYMVYPSVQTTNVIRWGWLRIQHKLDASGNILYQNTLSGHGANAPAETTSASGTDSYGNTVVNEPILLVTAEGIKGPVRRMITAAFLPVVPTTTSETSTTTTVVTDPFSKAAHAQGNVAPGTPAISLLGNNFTDSYDSRTGAYGGSNVHHQGDISTDVTSAGAISLGPNTTVNGSVAVGPSGNTGTAIVGTGAVTGTKTTEGATWNMPLPTIPTGVINSGSLSVSGHSTVTLSAGTYWFSSISITGSAQLATTGAVKIYVTGPADIGGNGIATAGNLPPNLLIYGTADPTNPANTCTSVSIHGNGNFYGAVYAPAAAIQTSGNGEVFGALSGNTVLINGSGHGGLHYDEALGHLGEITTTTTSTTTTTNYTFTGYKRYSWREIAF